MSLRPQDRVQRNGDLPFQRIGEEIIVVAPAQRLMHRIEGTGVRIWELIEKPVTVRSVVDTLHREFQVEIDPLQADVLKFLEELVDLKIVDRK